MYQLLNFDKTFLIYIENHLYNIKGQKKPV